MPFQRFVETGRVAYIAGGPYRGKLAAIVDVIDQTRALVDGPTGKVPRTAVRFNQLRLTKFRLRFPYKASTRVVLKKWNENKIDEKWKDTKWAKNQQAKRKRRDMTDLDRFKLRHARRLRNKIRTVAFNTLMRKDNQLREKSRIENKGKKGYGRRPKKAVKSAAASPAKKAKK